MTPAQYMFRTRFAAFVDFAFRELHPEEMFHRNWHIEVIADVLQWISNLEGEPSNRMILNSPPGTLKTHICSISLPAWFLGRNPRKTVLIVSESPELALDLQSRCGELMSSRRYQTIFPAAGIARSSRVLELRAGGKIGHCGIGQLAQPKSDLVVIDNPQSLYNLDRVKPQMFTELWRLLKHPKKSMMVVNTRRLADDDLSDFLRRKLTGWGLLSFPAVALDHEEWILPTTAHTRMKGELLHPAYEGWDHLMERVEELGGEAFSQQYLQSRYTPLAWHSRPYVSEHGENLTMIGNFGATESTADFLVELDAEYRSNLAMLT